MKQLVLLFAFTSAAMLLTAFAVVRGYASLQSVSLRVLATFVLVAGIVQWWNKRSKLEISTKESGKTIRALMWLLALFSASAGVAVMQVIHEKWDIGDTIGLGFFMLFAGLAVYEIFRHKRIKSSR